VLLLTLDDGDDPDQDISVLLNDPAGTIADIDVYDARLSRKNLRLLRAEIERYEQVAQRDGASARPGRASDFHRERSRAIATLIWEREPELTIESLLGRDEMTRIAQESVKYTAKTVRGWIKDLCPNRKPGRRPKNSRGEHDGSLR